MFHKVGWGALHLYQLLAIGSWITPFISNWEKNCCYKLSKFLFSLRMVRFEKTNHLELSSCELVQLLTRVKFCLNLRWIMLFMSQQPTTDTNVEHLRDVCILNEKVPIWYTVVAARSSGILKVKQKLGRTFNSDKLGGIAFTKISKLTMCSA